MRNFSYKYLIIFFCLISSKIYSQVLPSDTIPAKINYKLEEEKATFNTELRELRAIAGAPAPFYTYFWEFGDGNFSFKKEPEHFYLDTGNYKIRVYATNNYDDGKPPTTKPSSIKIKTKPNQNRALALSSDFFKPENNLTLKTNRMPRPEEEMVAILGYKNNDFSSLLSKSGTLVLFYNDTQFEKNNFEITDIRNYHKETKIDFNQVLQLTAINTNTHSYYASNGPNAESFNQTLNSQQILQEKKANFKNIEAWKYNNLEKNSERFIFINFKTTPEMIKDTNAVVNLSAVMLPDDPLADISVFNLELQIVASYDPNKMILKNRYMNYRFLGKNKTLTYKVKFQNTGKGPAKVVDIGVTMPSVLDKSSIKILDTYPKVLVNKNPYVGQSHLDTIIKAEKVHFIFKNIYLPGVQQDGVNDTDSTKGFVEYQIKLKEKPKKIPFASSAAIIFDKNEPIYTNKARGKFLPGISPGIIVGYGFLNNSNTINNLGDKNYTLGFSISPYSPFRKFLQAELYLNGYNSSNNIIKKVDIIRDTVIADNATGGRSFLINGKTYYQQKQAFNIDIVPIQLRYNLNSFIGVGAGTLTALTIYEKTKIIEETGIMEQNTKDQISFYDKKITEEKRNKMNAFNVRLFGDIQLGFVRKGPSLGIRYLHSLSEKDKRIFTYLSFKI